MLLQPNKFLASFYIIYRVYSKIVVVVVVVVVVVAVVVGNKLSMKKQTQSEKTWK